MKRLSDTTIEFDNVTIQIWYYQTTDYKGNPLSDKVIIHYSDGEYSLVSTVSMSPKEIEKLDQMYKDQTKIKLELSIAVEKEKEENKKRNDSI